VARRLGPSYLIALSSDLARLETVGLDVLREQLLELLDVLLLLGLHVPPELLQVCQTVRVGDVLVVSPHAVQASAQFVNQVVIVILTSARLSEVFVFFLRFDGHGAFPLQKEASKATEQTRQHSPRRTSTTKKADVEEHPQVFHHVGLLFNKPPDLSPNSTGRVALYLVIRRLQFINEAERSSVHDTLPAGIVSREIGKGKDYFLHSPNACQSEHSQECDEVCLLVRVQLEFQDQVEELHGIVEREQSAVVEVNP
jgi:hypothetical protein